MGKYCYGAFLKVLRLCSPRSTTQKFLCGTMFKAVNPSYDITEDDGAVSHLINCSNNVSPNVTDNIATADVNRILGCFEKEIIPKLFPDRHKHIILALTDILLSDNSIDESCPIGVIGLKEKFDYRLETEFVLSEFLTDFFIFSINGISNKSGAEFIGEINEEFIEAQGTHVNNITLSNRSSVPLPCLKKTLRARDFNSVFQPVATAQMGLKNREELKIFRLKIEDNQFSYTGLRKLLNTNLGRYVYSRVTMEEYRKNDDLESVGGEAAQYIREHATGNELADMLLYAFLEEVLNAPKILSAVELNDGENRCSGIHLYTVPGIKSTYQLVYGTSKIRGNLKGAIDDAFINIREMKSQRMSGTELVNSTSFNRSVDYDTARQIKMVVVPQRRGQEPPDSAFGIFLGYSLGLDPEEYSPSEFVRVATQKMESDINEQAEYIYSKVRELRMGMHSFYIYVLPFNNADVDRTEIIMKLIGGAAV